MRRRSRWLVMAAVGATALGCGEGGAPEGPGTEDSTVLRVAYNREIDVLNPFTSQNLVDIQFSMIEGLITTNDRNTYIPVLAREIPTLTNGLITDNGDGTWDMVWPLHEGVRWHDGEPFTSDDVCFTWRFVSSEGSQVYNREMYLGILRCSTPDEHTVVFTWDGLYGYYAGIFEAVLPETCPRRPDHAGDRRVRTVQSGPRDHRHRAFPICGVAGRSLHPRGSERRLLAWPRRSRHRRDRLVLHPRLQHSSQCLAGRRASLRPDRPRSGRPRGIVGRVWSEPDQLQLGHALRSQPEHRAKPSPLQRP